MATEQRLQAKTNGASRLTAEADAVELAFEDFILGAHALINALGDSDIFQKFSIEPSEWAVLKALDEGTELPLSQVVRRCGIQRARVNAITEQLVAKNLVTVRRVREGEKRERIIAATPEAARIRDDILAGLAACVGAMMGDAAAPERKERLAQRFANAARLTKNGLKAIRPQRKGVSIWSLETLE